MAATLYVVPGSHPCAAVERALELKGIAYDRVDLLPVAHRLLQQRRFGARTVPALELDGGEQVVGSREIVRRLDELVAEPGLCASDPDVGRAERWGDEVLQPIVRRLAWAALRRSPRAMTSYAEGADLGVPIRIAALGNAPVAALAARLNGASDAAVRADLIHLPHHLDRIDRWIELGVLGGAAPNAADLQVGAGVRLALTLEDLAPQIDARPAGALARRHFPAFPGRVPAGALPAAWLSAAR